MSHWRWWQPVHQSNIPTCTEGVVHWKRKFWLLWYVIRLVYHETRSSFLQLTKIPIFLYEILYSYIKIVHDKTITSLSSYCIAKYIFPVKVDQNNYMEWSLALKGNWSNCVSNLLLTGACASSLNIDASIPEDGLYKSFGTLNGRPSYKHETKEFYIFYAGWWKLDTKHWYEAPNPEHPVGFIKSNDNVPCPEQAKSWSSLVYDSSSISVTQGQPYFFLFICCCKSLLETRRRVLWCLCNKIRTFNLYTASTPRIPR